MTTVPRFSDELFRPLVTLAISVITVIHLVERPPLLPEPTWTLTVVAIAAAVASVLVADTLPQRWVIALMTTFVLVSAPLFALAPSTAAVAFVLLATSTAGRQLESRHNSLALAVAGDR